MSETREREGGGLVETGGPASGRRGLAAIQCKHMSRMSPFLYGRKDDGAYAIVDRGTDG